MASPLDTIAPLQEEALAQLAEANDPDALETWRIAFIGSKGKIKGLMGQIKDVPGPDKRAFGQAANAARQAVESAFKEKQQNLGSQKKTGGPLLDITEPPPAPTLGRLHPTRQVLDDLLRVFTRMGFQIEEGPEVEDERHNFDALNIPRTHPARDVQDNFYLTDPADDLPGGPRLLRSQTSTVQIRVMERVVAEGMRPIRIVSPGRVYRPDEHDATHYSMFHQVEGLVVDKDVTMADLKACLLAFARACFGRDAEVKLVPSYFPFTEPSAELYLKMDLGKGYEWVEVGGCGMVDPAVFEAVGIDPEQYTGYAFGLGVERLVMKKLNISDIRDLFAGDVRFLKQF